MMVVRDLDGLGLRHAPRTSARTAHGHPRVSVVVPARNEAANLPHVLPHIPPWVHEVILVDGHSRDDTVEAARRILPGIRVVHQVGRGKGDALRIGFAACTGDVIVMIDADGSTDPREIGRFVEALEGGADFAKGSRFCTKGGSADITRLRGAGNGGLNLLVNTLFGTHFTDLCYGYNAFWRYSLDCFEVDCSGFEVETLINLRAHKANLRIVEVPSFEHQRIHGTSNLNTFRDGGRVLRTIGAEWARGRANITDARYVPARTFHLLGAAVSEQPDSADVSVIIAAYTEERWADLAAAVSSVQRQTVAPREIIVVIDHNTTLYARAQHLFDGVTVVENQLERGLSGARNTGLTAAAGAYVAFLDDDAVAEPDWLSHLAGRAANPLVLGSGGWVEPLWEGKKPAWLPEEFYWVVGCSYRGQPMRVAPIRNPIGSSMCIRRSVFEGVGGFREGIGRIGKHPVGCEETELCIRAGQRWPDQAFLHEPRARVRHRVPRSRATFRYFRRRCFYEGRSKALVVGSVGSRAGLASERAYTGRTLPLGVARGVLDALTLRDAAGLLRAAVIVLGILFTLAGYVTGRATMFALAIREALASLLLALSASTAEWARALAPETGMRSSDVG